VTPTCVKDRHEFCHWAMTLAAALRESRMLVGRILGDDGKNRCEEMALFIAARGGETHSERWEWEPAALWTRDKTFWASSPR